MSVARISIIGLMRYDDTIFDEVVLPSAPWSKYFVENNITLPEPDRDVLTAHILRRCANMEIFYPNTKMLKYALETWSVTNKYKWKKLWENLHYEYNPLYNKDAHYEEEEHYTRDLKDEYTETTSEDIDGKANDTSSGSTNGEYANSGSGTSTDNTTENGSRQTQSGGSKNSTTIDQISAFNVDGFQDREKSTYNETTTGNETVTTVNTTNHTGSTSDTKNGNYEETTSGTNNGTYEEATAATKDSTNDATGTYDILRSRREYGNIGVTTSSKLLEEDRQLAEFNWYDMVCDSFIAEFCIAVF